MTLEIYGDADQMTLTQMLSSSTPFPLFSQIFALSIPLHWAYTICAVCSFFLAGVGGEGGW